MRFFEAPFCHGLPASLLGVSFEAFLLDDEMLAHVYRMIRGVEVSEETLAFEAMKSLITGEDHCIGETRTTKAMERSMQNCARNSTSRCEVVRAGMTGYRRSG
jgi:trimethylamine:corrinoid methyltransferase-like protein